MIRMTSPTTTTSPFVFPQDQPDGPAGKARAGGMTLREHYAGQIMAQMPFHKRCLHGMSPEDWAEEAVELADALVAVLTG